MKEKNDDIGKSLLFGEAERIIKNIQLRNCGIMVLLELQTNGKPIQSCLLSSDISQQSVIKLLGHTAKDNMTLINRIKFALSILL